MLEIDRSVPPKETPTSSRRLAPLPTVCDQVAVATPDAVAHPVKSVNGILGVRVVTTFAPAAEPSLLVSSGSLLVAVLLTVLVSEPLAGVVTVSVRFVDAPLARLKPGHVTTPPPPSTPPPTHCKTSPWWGQRCFAPRRSSPSPVPRW